MAANHGDCPLGPLQQRLGDPVPLFELLLSPTAARRAVPALGSIAAAECCCSSSERGSAVGAVDGAVGHGGAAERRARQGGGPNDGAVQIGVGEVD